MKFQKFTMLIPPLVFPLKWTEIKKKKSLKAVLSFHTFPSILTEKLMVGLTLQVFETLRGWIANF